ncbi:tyrosine-type recombinase/integrase [Streptomyces antimycoticus]|uniref:tyrosine-type recombinase/integrase n=1 Tax=Streptomyces antimycoticus TaxID=68175 RepID=UPI0036E0E54B
MCSTRRCGTSRRPPSGAGALRPLRPLRRQQHPPGHHHAQNPRQQELGRPLTPRHRSPRTPCGNYSHPYRRPVRSVHRFGLLPTRRTTAPAPDCPGPIPQTRQRSWIPRITLHDLRHLAATLTLTAGIPLTIVSKTLRHSTLSTTANIYSHPPTASQPQGTHATTTRPPHRNTRKRPSPLLAETASDLGKRWSGRQDLNLRPLDPQRAAILLVYSVLRFPWTWRPVRLPKAPYTAADKCHEIAVT